MSAPASHRDDRRDRRRRRDDRVELGRLRAALTAVATVDRERADRLEERLTDLERTLGDVVARLDELEAQGARPRRFDRDHAAV